MPHETYMREAIAMARDNIQAGGRPFGAILTFENKIIARAANEIHLTQDPTAHAELLAIRQASAALSRPNLQGCVVYASGHPCPMCLAAMHLSGIQSAYFAYSNQDGAPYGLSTEDIYAQMQLPPTEQQLPLIRLRPTAEDGLYDMWNNARRTQ